MPDPVTRSQPDPLATTDQPTADSLSTTGDGTTPALSASPTIAPQQVPGFVLESELGRGGMGVVYKAHQLGLNRAVALKMILGADRSDPKHLLRFLAEADAVAAIKHPNVVGVYEYGDADGRPFLALEYCAGGSLTDRLKREKRLAPRVAAQLIADIAAGVNAAHDRGIVHRDLKPGNVLFDTPNGSPKVADFGLAKRDGGADLTQTQAVMGTPAYMAPEQAKGQTKFVGPQSDVWALGVMLYECLTGTRPFVADDTWQILRKVTDEEPQSVRTLVGDVPRDLELICFKCLRKEPIERYATAGELADDLRRFLTGEPILARPAGPIERAAKWVKRNPIATSLIVALALLVAVVGVGGYITNQTIQQANAEEVGRLRAEQQEALTRLQGSMRLALRSGEAKKAVEEFDAAVAAGLPVTPEMRFDKAKALYALNDPDGVRREIAAMEGEQLPPTLRGQVALLAGTLTIGDDDAAAVALLRRARALGLPPADDLFAKGLLATTTPEALAAFQAAIEADTRHVDARAMAAMTMLCLGRLDDAIRLAEQSRPLAPAHPHFTAVLIASWILKGDREMAKQHFKAARDQFPDPKQYEAALGLFDVAGTAFGVFRSQLAGESFNFLTFSLEFLPGGKLDSAIKKLSGSGISTGGTLLRTPPFFRNAMQFFVNEALASIQSGNSEAGPVTMLLKGWLPGFAIGKPALWVNNRNDLAAARAKLAEHPEGTLKHVFANRVYEIANGAYSRSGRDEASRQLLAEAGAAFEDAATTPGLFNLPHVALESAYICYLQAGQPSVKHPGRPEWRQKAVSLLRQRMTMAEPFKSPAQFIRAVAVALRGEEDELARMLLTEWARTAPTDWFYHACLAQLDYRLGAYEAALRSVEQIPAKDLNESIDREKLISIQTDCRRRLELPELAPAPRVRRRSDGVTSPRPI